MKKMKLSFISAVLLVFATGMGQMAYGQVDVFSSTPGPVNLNNLDSEAAFWRNESKTHLDDNQYNFVDKSEALEILHEELLELNDAQPSGGVEEAIVAIKKAFVIGATSVLKQGGTVEEALIAGTTKAGNVASGYSVVDDDYPLDLLEFYADLVSN